MQNKKLISHIEQKRSELFEVASKHGMNSHIAIKYSQELDKLINQYNRINLKRPTKY